MDNTLPPIPAKRYFTIGEVGELCGVKPHVLRYWEQEFTQLRPMKRRGNRRYYQHHEVLMIRRIRELLYEQGFTIHGARNRLQEIAQQEREQRKVGTTALPGSPLAMPGSMPTPEPTPVDLATSPMSWSAVRQELLSIRNLLSDPASSL